MLMVTLADERPATAVIHPSQRFHHLRELGSDTVSDSGSALVEAAFLDQRSTHRDDGAFGEFGNLTVEDYEAELPNRYG